MLASIHRNGNLSHLDHAGILNFITAPPRLSIISTSVKQTLSVIPCGLMAMFLASCGETTDMTQGHGRTQYLEHLPGRTGSANSAIDTVSYWDGDGVPGSPRIKIDLSDQKAYYFKGDELVGVAMISTGREGYDTPIGQFSIIQKNADHRSNLYGEWVDSAGNVINNDVDVKKTPVPPPGLKYVGAPMPYFMRVTGGVGMHAGFLPGFPASHGCIRMPEHMAQRFFAESPLKTPVEISR
jgi:hypothetical protein